MCYYTFVRYTCGCAPLEPALVLTTDTCPWYCPVPGDPPLHLNDARHLNYFCHNCRSSSDLSSPPTDWREEARRQRRAVSSMPQYREEMNAARRRARHEENVRQAAACPGDWVFLEDGRVRRKTRLEKAEEARRARRAGYIVVPVARAGEREGIGREEAVLRRVRSTPIRSGSQNRSPESYVEDTNGARCI